jgi:hypothetical protein
MNNYSYNYTCYILGEYIYGSLNLNSTNDKNALNEAKEYLHKNVSNRFCFINFENKTKTEDNKQNASHNTYLRIPISYTAK